MADLRLNRVTKSYGDHLVIEPLDLAAEAGEFVVFVGPSGCGKSTLLRMIAGLENTTGGEIEIGGKAVTHLSPVDRGVAMVFQSYALYPHMTVEENIGFGLKIAGLPKAERKAKVAKAAEVLQLTPYLQRKPKALSGGQRQRVAIGRAIVKEPRIFLFDEPLSNLDAELRVQMRLEVARLHQELGATMVYVTHDQVEAMTLADKIVVLRAGRIEQVGSPMELYENPDNTFVAGFIGSPKMNFVNCTVESVSATGLSVAAQDLGSATFTVTNVRGPVDAGAKLTMGFRPEHITTSVDFPISGRIDVVERLGNVTYAHVATVNGARIILELRGDDRVRQGDTISFKPKPDRVLLFDPNGQRV
ncbi:ABC transporter ATP-binding protein [Ensifer sp. YR511]|uniref:ABC transporter ATP-binding protein n=1 Tax=Ensifer sp. YR511 TaxID=1855294 RepID=UPI00088DC6E6|nr:sn-glycerol-3-phosphate ABC transporter ATP-binding protein UgpC [Ensifer sp. YR511]SDN79184.1 carbohydrate ABC transporter ATP-binding protein, CUT1 family [Ensifer sp. YR511]